VTFSTWDVVAGWFSSLLQSACRRGVRSASIFGPPPISQATWRNAELEGVRGRIELHTADKRRLPFRDESFDVVTSSLTIHNIKDAQGREQALAEILRVLKKGGTAMISDVLHIAEYQRYVFARPGARVEHHCLSWRFRYGGPHAATILVKIRRVNGP